MGVKWENRHKKWYIAKWCIDNGLLLNVYEDVFVCRQVQINAFI